MITELSAVLISILSLSTAGTIGGALWYRHHHKKMNKLKEELESVNVELAKIRGESDKWHLYQEQLDVANKRIKDLLEINAQKETRNAEIGDRYNQRINEVEERFNKQTTFLRSVQRDLNTALCEKNDLTIRIGEQQRIIDHLKQWLCRRPWTDCKRREPEQAIKPKKYIELADLRIEQAVITEETVNCDCNG